MKPITICILGGGPAGLATALALRKYGFDITVLEATSYDSYRAGEHIIPQSLPFIEALQIPGRIIENNSIRCYAVNSFWGGNTLHSRDSIFNAYGEGFLLSRPAFDRDLAAFVQSQEVDLKVDAKVKSLGFEDGRWLVNYLSKIGTESLKADFLIDATGKNSQFTSALGTKKYRYDNLIGITGIFKSKKDKPVQNGSILVEAVENGWWYSTVLQDDTLVATFMTDGNLLNKTVSLEENFQNFIDLSKRTKGILSNWRRVGKARAVAAISQIQSKLVGESYLAVGDAAWSVDPLSSQGIFKAITMGTKAAEAVRAYFTNDPLALQTYEHEFTEMFYEYLILRAGYYRLERRWPENEFWKRRQAPCWPEIPIAIDPVQGVDFHPGSVHNYQLKTVTPSVDQELLLNILGQSRTALEAAASYKSQATHPIDDKELIIAIQEMMAAAM